MPFVQLLKNDTAPSTPTKNGQFTHRKSGQSDDVQVVLMPANYNYEGSNQLQTKNDSTLMTEYTPAPKIVVVKSPKVAE